MTDLAYRATGRFWAELAACGVTDVVVSPGSRSTPLAVAARNQDGLRVTVQLDERVAGVLRFGDGQGIEAACRAGLHLGDRGGQLSAGGRGGPSQRGASGGMHRRPAARIAGRWSGPDHRPGETVRRTRPLVRRDPVRLRRSRLLRPTCGEGGHYGRSRAQPRTSASELAVPQAAGAPRSASRVQFNRWSATCTRSALRRSRCRRLVWNGRSTGADRGWRAGRG